VKKIPFSILMVVFAMLVHAQSNEGDCEKKLREFIENKLTVVPGPPPKILDPKGDLHDLHDYMGDCGETTIITDEGVTITWGPGSGCNRKWGYESQ